MESGPFQDANSTILNRFKQRPDAAVHRLFSISCKKTLQMEKNKKKQTRFRLIKNTALFIFISNFV